VEADNTNLANKTNKDTMTTIIFVAGFISDFLFLFYVWIFSYSILSSPSGNLSHAKKENFAIFFYEKSKSKAKVAGKACTEWFANANECKQRIIYFG
jgi:hypothetical protein